MAEPLSSTKSRGSAAGQARSSQTQNVRGGGKPKPRRTQGKLPGGGTQTSAALFGGLGFPSVPRGFQPLKHGKWAICDAFLLFGTLKGDTGSPRIRVQGETHLFEDGSRQIDAGALEQLGLVILEAGQLHAARGGRDRSPPSMAAERPWRDFEQAPEFTRQM